MLRGSFKSELYFFRYNVTNKNTNGLGILNIPQRIINVYCLLTPGLQLKHDCVWLYLARLAEAKWAVLMGPLGKAKCLWKRLKQFGGSAEDRGWDFLRRAFETASSWLNFSELMISKTSLTSYPSAQWAGGGSEKASYFGWYRAELGRHGNDSSHWILHDELAQPRVPDLGPDESKSGGKRGSGNLCRRGSCSTAPAHHFHYDGRSGIQRHWLSQLWHQNTRAGQTGCRWSEVGELLHPAHLHPVPKSTHHRKVTFVLCSS